MRTDSGRSEELLGKIGGGQGQDAAEHPLQDEELAVLLDQFSFHPLDIGFRRQLAFQCLGEDFLLCLGEGRGLLSGKPRLLQTFSELQGVKRNRAHA